MNNNEEETKPIGDKEERALTLMLQGRKDNKMPTFAMTP